MRRVGALLAAVVLLAACGGPGHGLIEAKHYDPPYSYYTFDCIAYSSKGACTFHMMHYHHVPANYEFELRTSKHEGWTDVPPSSWDRYQIGQQYP